MRALLLTFVFTTRIVFGGDAPGVAEFKQGLKALNEGRWEESAKTFRIVLEKYPAIEPMWTRNNLGYALFNLKKNDDAAVVYMEALAQPAKSHHTRLFINALQNELARNNSSLAMKICEQGTQEFPNDAWLWDNMAWVQTLRQDRAAAAKNYDLACKLAIKNETPSHETSFTLPFSGRWLVVQGNGGNFSHRSLSGRFAWDFVASNGEPLNPGTKRNEDYFSYGKEVLAAADGKVVEWNDSVTDNVPGTLNPASARGNYVTVQHREGEFTCYYHLQRGSVQVKLNDPVKRGQPLAKCGNSGFSTQPHLHFALLDDRGTSGISHPLKFSKYTVIDKASNRAVESGAPAAEQIVQTSE